MTHVDDTVARRFDSLDAYLAWLEQNEGPAGGAWYQQVGPDLYELQTGNLHLDGADAGKTAFTRAELEAKFGFAS